MILHGPVNIYVPYKAVLLMWMSKTHVTYKEDSYATRFR